MGDFIKEKRQNLNVVIFTLGKERFGVDVKNIREVLKIQEISPLPKMPPFIEGVINLRGHIIGVIDLRKLFELKKQVFDKETRIMIVRIKNALVGLIVDSVLEVTSIPEEAVEAAPPLVNLEVKNSFIKAVAKKDDKMVFILSLDLVLDEEELRHLVGIRRREGNA
ncbi:MAG: chemotaxis protein CheW [Candidatus Omnitrophota bacterium]|nr:chemotaxis protein CheW [Candidatus Omnitrophota bacterium]